MIKLDIRARMLLAALVPVTVISLLLSVVFLMARFDDMQESYQQRTRSVARQLALASEYGLFSANLMQLQTVVRGALREPDVRWVVVLDNRGQPLASAGDASDQRLPGFDAQETQVYDVHNGLDTLAQPVFASSIKLDDVFEDTTGRNDGLPAQLGQVVVKFSRQSVNDRKNSMLLLGGLISVAGLLFSMALAARLGRGVIRPIMRVANLIERIGRGDFGVVADISSEASFREDPLYGLQQNLRQMAERLGHAREDLEHQINQATQALREKKEEAELANQAKSRFLAAASHDLRQPTHALGLFVARLAQLPHDMQTRQLIGHLDASVRAMQNLLDGLLDISRLEAQAVQVKLRPFALADLLTQVHQEMAPAALDKGLQLRIHQSSVWVLSDVTLLHSVLLNLVGNALRYTEYGGVLVAARLVDSGRQVKIQVWDSGIGIALEHQEDVFKEFYQVGNLARDRQKGLGLGLNIVQRMAGLMGHPLELVSRLGHGSRFTLTLPVVLSGDVEPTDPLPERIQADDLNSLVVLVIEDDALVRVALTGLLEGCGMQVHAAQSLSEAGGWVSQGLRPAMILSDYRLQEGTNGIEAVQQLRLQLDHAVPACLMSGDTHPELMLVAKSAGLTLLHKPVRPAKLRNLLRRLLSVQPTEEDFR